jgi:hypothetical protein
MIDINQFEVFYQQWLQGNERYPENYMDFVRMICKIYNLNEEELLTQLEQCRWWKRNR